MKSPAQAPCWTTTADHRGMRIALKVDVDTYRGTLEGVPALLALFARYQIKASFLFSLGPDHTGRAIRRVFRPGFLSKVQRTSVTEHYGCKTLMYGVLLPGPHIGRKAGHIMRQVRSQGHEVGIHCYDHVRWHDFVSKKDEKWTRRELERAIEIFREVFDAPPKLHGAAGWQINQYVPRLEEQMGFTYASDVRGYSPFYPVMHGIESRCVQIPTTLPTLDELIGCNGNTPENVHHAVLAASRELRPHGHVYTLHAELEGMKLLPVMENLLRAWQEREDKIVTLKGLYNNLDLDSLQKKPVVMGKIPGRAGTLALEV